MRKMAWLRLNDTFVNLDCVALVEFKELDTGIWVEFSDHEGELLFMWRLSEEDAEKLKMALQYATKATTVYLKEGEKVGEETK